MMLALVLACSVEEVAMQTATLNPMHTIDRNIDRTPVQVQIAERVEAGGYLYLRTNESPPRWLATLDKPVYPGANVTVKAIGVARPFHSRRTGMHFDALWFSVVTP